MTEIILGPPGTGKTTTLLNILDEELTAGVDPGRIGYVSFTTRAASEAAARACARFGFERDQLPHFRTLHSLCFRQLGLRGADVLAGDKLYEFADWCGIRVTGRAWSDDGLLTRFEEGDRMLFMENLARIRMVPLRAQYDLSDDGLDWSEVDRVARALAEYKSAHGLLDYTDMLTEFVRSGVRVQIDRLLVDESQDLSALQWRVVGRLAETASRVCVAGDDDQAIYRWAGADVEHLIGMRGDARVLGQSYRCPLLVQALSQELIASVASRRPKTWRAREENGEIVRAGTFDDADVDQDWEEDDREHQKPPVLVLARNTKFLERVVLPALRARGVVYEMKGKSSLNLSALRAAECWERLRAHKTITVAEAREVYEYLPANDGVKRGHKRLPAFRDEDAEIVVGDLVARGGLVMSLERQWHEALTRLPKEDMSYMLAARRRGERLRQRPRVVVSTIHGAKGGEASHVVLLTDMAHRTHEEMHASPDDERRVFYVGVTRAKRRLTVVDPQTAFSCPWL